LRNSSLSSFFRNADMYTRLAVVSALNYIQFVIEEQGINPFYVYRRYDKFVKYAIESAEAYAKLPSEIKQVLLAELKRQKKLVFWYWIRKHVRKLRYLLWKFVVMEVLSIAFRLRC